MSAASDQALIESKISAEPLDARACPRWSSGDLAGNWPQRTAPRRRSWQGLLGSPVSSCCGGDGARGWRSSRGSPQQPQLGCGGIARRPSAESGHDRTAHAGDDVQRRVAGDVSPLADRYAARPRQRLSDRLASRPGSTGEGRRFAGGNRNAGARPGTGRRRGTGQRSGGAAVQAQAERSKPRPS